MADEQQSLVTTIIAGAVGMEPAPPGSQPSLGAELAALYRQGREDFLNIIMGGLGGTRESGTPGNPTPQMVTESLEGREVDLQQDRLEPPQKMTLDDLRAYAKERAAEAEQSMERGMERDSGGMEM